MKRKLTTVPLTEVRDGRYLFAFCFVMYFVLYLGRLNLSAAIAEITTTGVMGKDAAGLISTAFFITSACGQLINGFLSDRLNPFGMICISFLGSGAANLCMYFAALSDAPLWVYLLIWGINGYAQSAVWPTIVRILSTILPDEMRVSAGSNILASSAVGMVAANLIYSAIMKAWGWQICFLFPGIVMLFVAAIWFGGTRSINRRCLRREVQVSNDIADGSAGSAAQTKKNDMVHLLAVSGGFVMMLIIIAYIFVKESVSSWAPTLITEAFSVEPSFAVAVSTGISLAGIFAAAGARFIVVRWLHDELKSTAFFFIVTAVCLGLLLTVGMKSLWLMLILLALSVVCLLGINIMMMSLVPLRFGRYGIASTMAGILNAVACVSAGLASYVTGLLTETGGWTLTIGVWLGLVIVGLLITLAITRRWLRFKAMK